MTSVFLDDVEYTLSSKVTDIHFALIEKAVSNLTDLEIQSQAGFLLKFVVFTEKLSDDYVESIEDKYVIFLEIEQLIDIYKSLHFARTEKILKQKQSKLAPDSEDYKNIEQALQKMSALNQSLDGKKLIDLGQKEKDDKEAIIASLTKVLKEKKSSS